MDKLDKIALDNFNEVKTWDKWMQKIIITAEAANTGCYIRTEKEWKEIYG